MNQLTRVIIAIQARSNSKRFPGKIYESIGGKPMLHHVISAATNSARYMNMHGHKDGTIAEVALVIPEGDDLAGYSNRHVRVIQGPEHDVLGRYKIMSDKMRADYIVRITADCPLIPPFLISKHITIAIQNQYDYLSNVDESTRTSADGFDCEIMSKWMLQWLDENAKTPSDREHVTPMARREPPGQAKVGFVLHYLDLSNMKLSVDTMEDLERVRAVHDRLSYCMDSLTKKYGKQSIHRI